jgi:hypothetical protein
MIYIRGKFKSTGCVGEKREAVGIVCKAGDEGVKEKILVTKFL